METIVMSVVRRQRGSSSGVGAWKPSFRGFGIAKILKKLQLHSARAVIRWTSVKVSQIKTSLWTAGSTRIK
jgi:hypothetical protein